jgi:acyl carrier protein
MNWVKYFKGMVRDRGLPYFDGVSPVAEPAVTSPSAADPADILASLRQASGEERRDLLGRFLQEGVAKVLGYKDPGQVERDITLLELGLDSLTAVQLRNLLGANLGAHVPASDLLEETSLEALTDLVQDQLERPMEVI